MKTKLNTFKIIIALSLAMVSGCRNLLDTPLENKPLANTTDFTNSSNMNLPLLGMYANLYSLEWEVYPLLSVLGDDVNAGGLGDQAAYTATDRYVYDNGYWMYNSVWNDMYNRIFVANSSIEQLLKYKAYATDKASADQYIAEVKVIRAWVLYQMTKMWGLVFIPTGSDPLQLYTAKISTQEEVLNYIVSEMNASIPLLLDASPSEKIDFRGRVTKYTALAVKAMASLLLKNYQEVADATGAIINSNKFDLEPDFTELFNTKGKLNQENLFEIQGANITGRNIWWFQVYGPTDWAPSVTGAGGGWGFFEPSLKWIRWMIARNETVRLETAAIFTPRGIKALQATTTVPAWITSKLTTVKHGKADSVAYKNKYGDAFINIPREMFLSGKHYLPTTQLSGSLNDYGANKNLVIIRYAEVLLMYAEALSRGATGKGMSAVDAVNKVRDRAKLPILASVTADDVMNEKFAELAMEWGIRYVDMTRLQKYDELSYDGRTFTADKIHLPYPQGQIDQIPLLRGVKNN